MTMTHWQPRIPVTFESSDGNTVVTFPLAEYSYELEQELRGAWAVQSGAHGEYDLLRAGASPKGSQHVRLSFSVYHDTPAEVETAADALMAAIWSIGRGKLWTLGLNSSDTDELRWTWARAITMPSVRWEAGDVLRKALTLGFTADPFWYGETALYAEPITIDADPFSLTVANSGNAPIYGAVFTLAGDSTGPVILNTTNGYRMESTQATSNSLRFDAGRPAVEMNDGVSWVNDYGSFVRQSGQVHLMILEPGDNDLTITGLDGTLDIAAYPAFH